MNEIIWNKLGRNQEEMGKYIINHQSTKIIKQAEIQLTRPGKDQSKQNPQQEQNYMLSKQMGSLIRVPRHKTKSNRICLKRAWKWQLCRQEL